MPDASGTPTNRRRTHSVRDSGRESSITGFAAITPILVTVFVSVSVCRSIYGPLGLFSDAFPSTLVSVTSSGGDAQSASGSRSRVGDGPKRELGGDSGDGGAEPRAAADSREEDRS